MLPDAHIYKAIECLQYIQYWDEEINQLNETLKKLADISNIKRFTDDLDKYKRIRANFNDLIGQLVNMNTLTSDELKAHDFDTLIQAIEAAQA